MDLDINQILWFYDCRKKLDKSHFKLLPYLPGANESRYIIT